MEHIFRSVMRLDLAPEAVCDFFGDAINLEKITPSELCFKILTPPPIILKPGAIIDYQLRLFGFPFRWRTEITEWNPPTHFTDVQLKGPYRQWIHTHTFRPDGGGTIIEDEVRYSLPFSPLGEIAFPLVRYQIGRIFRFREQAARRLLDGFPRE